jgi:hypothetical protein
MAGSPYRIRVKYCGGCNPEIDRGGIVKQLEASIQSEGANVVFVTDDGDVDLLLLVQGCARACVEEDHPELIERTPFLAVQGARLDFQPVPEEGLAERVWRKIEGALAGSKT